MLEIPSTPNYEIRLAHSLKFLVASIRRRRTGHTELFLPLQNVGIVGGQLFLP